MKKLIDYTQILRSKNAGPLFITFDLIFDNIEDMDHVKKALSKDLIAASYQIDAEKIEIVIYEVVKAIKITFPRKHISGSIFDDDIYGCQQHMTLANIRL